MLRSLLPHLGVTHLKIVGAGEDDAWEILRFFTGEIGQLPAYHSVSKGGFSHFVVGLEGQPFLKA